MAVLIQDTVLSLKLATVTGINGKLVGTTTLYTVPSGQTAVITGVSLRVTAATAITADTVAGVGVAAGEDDLFTPEILTDIRAVNDVWVFASKGRLLAPPTGSVIKLGIDTGAVGTTLTLAADVFGFLI